MPVVPQVMALADIAYRDAEGYDAALNTLDIYHAPLRKPNERRPVVAFIHGGNWGGGDKACFGDADDALPSWFVRRGCVFAAINFRLPGNARSPTASVSDALDDLAKALKWLSINARRFGGGTSGFVLLGYSSGAHLAALLASDASHLQRYRLSTADIRQVIALDVPHYDLPMALDILQREDVGLTHQPRRLLGLYQLFGATPALQARFSPAAYIGPWLQGTSFLLLSAGQHLGQPQTFSRRMSEHYAQLLTQAHVTAEHHHFHTKDHGDFIKGLGKDVAHVIDRFMASHKATP